MISIEEIKEIAFSQELPKAEVLKKRVEECIKVLQSEDKTYRPYDKDNKPGGLVDFVGRGFPVIVVPDLHARSYFLSHILCYDLTQALGLQMSVFDALKEKVVMVVCVGDLLHSEARAYDRWMEALTEFKRGTYTGPMMKEEMTEGLATQSLVMMCKTAFPKNFHILKGNHDNILYEGDGGNRGFYKFVYEGEMVPLFMNKYYGKALTKLISTFEKSLPLVVAFDNVVISHAEPAFAFSRKDIINGLGNDKIVYSFTWTDNEEAKAGSVKETLTNLLKKPEGARYIGGHRPVIDNYTTRQDGLYIQIHNTEKENIAIVKPNTIFDPEKDIYTIAPDTLMNTPRPLK